MSSVSTGGDGSLTGIGRPRVGRQGTGYGFGSTDLWALPPGFASQSQPAAFHGDLQERTKVAEKEKEKEKVEDGEVGDDWIGNSVRASSQTG